MNGLLRSLLIAPLVALPVIGAGYQERLVASADIGGGCTLRLVADDEGRALRLRFVPERPSCRASREALQSLLAAAFSRTAAPRLEGTYRSLFIGRLVEYPWLAGQLATAASRDEGWDKRRGRPVRLGDNAYVARLLSRREVTSQIESAIASSGYRIASATVEKVLVAELRDAREYEGPRPPGKLPFDAMVWFILERGPVGP